MAKRQHARCSNLFCALALAKDNFASFATLDLPGPETLVMPSKNQLHAGLERP